VRFALSALISASRRWLLIFGGQRVGERAALGQEHIQLPAVPHITLPEVLRHIEAEKIVLVILTPGTKAQPKQDRPLTKGKASDHSQTAP
jgi:hypothetical protein